MAPRVKTGQSLFGCCYLLQLLIPATLQLAGRETIPGIYGIVLLKSLSGLVFLNLCATRYLPDLPTDSSEEAFFAIAVDFPQVPSCGARLVTGRQIAASCLLSTRCHKPTS